MAWEAEEFVFTGTVKKSLFDILGLSEDCFISLFAARANPDNAGQIWCGKGTITSTSHRAGLLDPGDALVFNDLGKPIRATEFYFLNQTANDRIHMLAVVF